VDSLFERAGELTLEHATPERTYRLATIAVTDEAAEPSLAERFAELRTNEDLTAVREQIAQYVDAEPDKTLAFEAEMDLGGDEPAEGGYVCPMHPEVTSDTADRCPKCGMKLVPAQLAAAGGHHGHHGGHEGHGGHHGDHEDHGHEGHGHGHGHGGKEHGHGHQPPPTDSAQGIEWEDDMVEVNRLTTPSNMRWKLVDRETGAANAAIDWRFRVGDRVKLRLVNELDSDHPMPHPFHVHGAGRFLVLARDGTVEPNLVWKDTVLVRTGETVDILLDVTNPGRWMAHCHIAEHHESGMMLAFDVEPA